ncbi:uncharacterized protein KIAA1614 isoform X2 [Oncorhynchus keta]|uniref:uncharacterized protein KIAA1614 isoform X2 n=1 Tax=Oncorhynchus keta TaxID=8018 RepID=UPI0015F7C6CC|nr:uncharacterized protein KIAA1614 isoform X2 [Oncorhynchus keta]
MEKVAMADSFLPMPRVPQRAKPQTLQPGMEDQPSSCPSPEPATSTPIPTSPSPCPLSQLLFQQQPGPPGSAVSALQSKVKALSERNKAAGREAFKAGMDKKAFPVSSSLFGPVLVSWGSSSSDEDAESQGSTLHPVVPDSLMEGVGTGGLDFSLLMLPHEQGEGSRLENLSDVNANSSPLADNVSASNVAKPCVSPKGLWKATRPETLLLNGDASPVPDRSLAGAPGSQQRKARAHGGVGRELLRRDSLEGLRRCMGELGPQGPMGGLWRADSLESLCSSGSAMSLAERVEMNRGVLKQMLNKSQGPEPVSLSPLLSEASALCSLEREQRAEEVTQCNGRGSIALNDSDWDSGISLQDTEHSQRAFVSSEDLPLSPRHEQAKRLLERARMKARSFPLKADHTILPVQRDNPEQLSTAGASLHRALLAGKDSQSVSSATVPAVTSFSGNHSDSSSSDSACGPRRRPGQSPTRVRFEDESEKDAEVRYLERIRQRRRAGERAQGLLISKPNLSSYVNGRRDTDPGTGTVIERGHKKAHRAQEGQLNSGSHFKSVVAQEEALNRQCNSCGTFLEGGVLNPGLHPNLSPLNLNLHQNPSPPIGQNYPVNREGEEKVLMPCWVAPSEPSRTVRTELIKETYIGKVTPGDVADSEGMGLGSAGETDSSSGGGGGGGSVRVSTMKVKRRSRRGELLGTNGQGAPITMTPTPPAPRPNHSLVPMSSTNGIVVVPPNPYPIEQPESKVVGFPTHSPAPPDEPTNIPQCLKGTPFPPSPTPIKSALKSGPKSRPNDQRVVKLMPSPQYRLLPQNSLEDQGRGAAPSPQNKHSVGANFVEYGSSLGQTSSTDTMMPCIRPASLLKTSPSPARTAVEKMGDPASPEVEQHHPGMGELCPEETSIITPPPYRSGGDVRVRGPMRAEHQREDSPSPTQRVRVETEQREGRSKLSLRRFFSAIGLNGVGKLGKGRSSSMEQLSFQPRGLSPASPGLTSNPDPSLGTPKCPDPSQLRKAPSLQSLRMGSPFMQLRKSSSVQNLQSSKKKDRSSAYTPGDQPSSPALRGFQRALSVEDVGCPSGVRSVGRVAQAFPDGTLLLELSRPPDGPFGFLISRGKGRPDSGVYVEEMGDSSTEKLYAGLLGVGDELLEVNGEKVAGLSLDLVTCLMTQDNIASIRVLRHRRLPPPR